MYLKQLDIQGFKSFADKTMLEFRPGVTAVIGPNGSGKSNVSDAVRWVLGEQSIKSLRGNKSHDIIFAGTENRRQLGFAEVNLTIDNSSGLLPVSYEEVTVTRRLYRSGESEFYINKAPCRLKDIHELFMGTGVGRDGYSIIGQGRIDEILSNNSEERRSVFEEAAGIAKYKIRKLEAERKLEHTNQNLLRINDIIKEVETNLIPLKSQSEKASSFLILRDELRDLEINIFISNTDKINQNLKTIDLHLEEIKEELALKESNYEELNKTKLELKNKIFQIEVGFEQLQNSIFAEQNKIERINSDINLANEKIQNNLDNSIRFDNEITEFNKKITALTTEKETKLTKIENLRKNRESYLETLAQKENELAEIINSLSEDEKKIEDIKTDIIDKMNLSSEKKIKLSSLNTMKSNAISRFATIDNNLREISLNKDKTRMLKEDIKDSITSLANEKNTISSQISSAKMHLDSLKNSETDLKNDHNKLTSDITIKKSRYKFLSDTEKNHDGYFRSVKSILDECTKDKSFAVGIDGALASLITVPKEYELAIEIALGNSLNDIITDTPNTAKRIIEFLKNTKSGRATFLPISSIKPKKTSADIKKFNGFIGIASDLIKYDDKYLAIIDSLLGKTIIVDSIDSALKASKQISSYRLISLDGDIINTSGTMSGGSVNHKNEGIISRNREIIELKSYLEETDISLNKLTKELSSIQENIINSSSEIETLTAKLQTIELSLFTENEKLSNIDNELTNLDSKSNALNIEKEQLTMQEKSFNSDIESLEKEILDTDNFINAAQVKINEYKQNNKTQMEIRDRLSDDITDYKISLSSFDESILSVNEITDRIDSNIKELTNGINVRLELKESNGKEIISLRENILIFKQSISESESFILLNKTSLDNLKNEKIDLSSSLGKLEDNIIENIKDIEDTKSKYIKTETKKIKFDVDLENLNNKMWEDYQITYSTALEMKKDLGNIDIRANINKLKSKIQGLGSINIDSIEEYKQQNERFNFLSTQRNDLEESETKLQKVIADMTSIMKKEFMEQFSLINKNFSEVFSELFGGGKAEIRLTDENNILESGIEIEVQPPGKKLQSMSLLSGGERAFTAIALLFAILKINPSPFCILDEIEAALDDVNIYRFADYIKNFSNTIQFILITHRKGTMEIANTIYGVTMEEKGISKLISMKIDK